MPKAVNLTCEYFKNPIGIGESRPRFSWMLESDGTGIMQASYRIQVSKEDIGFSDPIWDSRQILSDRSVLVGYEGPVLESCTRYFFRVRISDSSGETSTWSNTAYFETGLLDTELWKAEFITPENEILKDPSCPYLRKEFDCPINEKDKEIFSARIYASTLGLYKLFLNGKPVGDGLLCPGWTSYGKRLQYQTYDVTSLLQGGQNAVGALTGAGWYAGYLAWEGRRHFYGDDTALLIQLHIRYSDGSEQVVCTDDSWKAHASPVVMSEIYHGEKYDARLELPGWDQPCFDDACWGGVNILQIDKSILTAQENAPVKAVETIRPARLIKTPAGENVVDMGQNMVGWVRFKVKGPRESKVVLKHAEVLDSDGNFYTDNLRGARQTVEYILRGSGTESGDSEDEAEGKECFQPHFTFHGFRYVKIDEYPSSNIDIDDFAGIVIHSDLERTGTFTCSNELVDRLQQNILWSMKGNFVDIPTDCPQRDERLGWTGDAQVFCRTASFLMNTAPFFRKWLRDLAADQLDNGGVPHVIPDILGSDRHSSSGWGDAAVICPWTIYLCFGDKGILSEQYESMTSWVEYIKTHSENGLIWNTGFHYGDWLGLDAREGSYTGATSIDFVSTAFYAYSVELLVKISKILDKKDAARRYTELHHDIIKAFRKEFITPSGRLAIPTQTAHVLALMFGLVKKKDRKRTVDTLVKYLEENDWHLNTGFLGTPYLCEVLSSNSRLKEAYRLLMQTDYPSWLYPVTKGATTIWEHWDGIRPDGTFWSERMNSFNHYAYGSIGDWMYRVIAGIDTSKDRPGYKHIIIKPRPGGDLTHAAAELMTPYGKVRSSWKADHGIRKIVLEITIPHNTTATIILPGCDKRLETGSGTYIYELDMQP